jgi:DNA-directed RNA polymerase subunit beta
MPFVRRNAEGPEGDADLIDAKTGEVVLRAAGKKISARAANRWRKGRSKPAVSSEELIGMFAAEDLVNAETGEIYRRSGRRDRPKK